MAPWIIPFQLHHWSGATDTTGFRALLFCLLDLGCLHSESSHQQIQTVLLLPSQFGCLLFLLLVWWLSPGLLVVCWIRGASGHPSLVPHLKGEDCSFCLLGMMLVVSLSYMAFIMFRYVPSTLTLLRLVMINGCWILLNALSASIDRIVCFSPHFVYMVNHICWSVNVVSTLHCWNKSHLIMAYDLCDALLYSVC